MRLLQKARVWEAGEQPRRAGVSSFGVSGTNAHLIVEEAPRTPKEGKQQGPEPGRAVPVLPLVISGNNEAAVRESASRLADHLLHHPEIDLSDVSFTLYTRRSHFSYRAAVITGNAAQAISSLKALSRGVPDEHYVQAMASPDTRVVFVFPGQGSQWPGMARTLYHSFPAFASALDEVAVALKPHTDWSLLEVLLAEESEQQRYFTRVDIVQPVLFAMGVALARAWQQMGVNPSAVVGHSQGEITAAHVAGALSLEDAAQVVAVRSLLLRQQGCAGAMATVALPLLQVQQRLAAYGQGLSVAVVNSPSSTGVAGQAEALAELLRELRSDGVFCREIAVDYASHSMHVDPVLPAFVERLRGLRPKRTQVLMVSTLDGKQVSGEELDGQYWARNLREPVRLDEALAELKRTGHRVYLELSAHPQLVTAINEVMQADGGAVETLRRHEGTIERLVRAAAGLAVRGPWIDWHAVQGRSGQLVNLPTYPFQRQRYWVDDSVQGRSGHDQVPSRRGGGHPLLGPGISLSTRADTQVWETELALDRMPWLGDHKVQGGMLFSCAGYLEMALSAGSAMLGGTRPLAINDVLLSQPLVLDPKAAMLVQVVATEERPGALRIQVSSLEAKKQGRMWTVHARAHVHQVDGKLAPPMLDLLALRTRMGTPIGAAKIYSGLAAMGLEYGQAFQGIVELWRSEGEALGRIVLPESAGDVTSYHIHPALLDACCQVTAGLWPEEETTPWVPVAVSAMCLHRRPGRVLYCHVRSKAAALANHRAADFVIADETGEVVAQVTGFTIQRLPPVITRREEDDWFLSLDWEERQVPTPRVQAGRWLLIGEGGSLGCALRTTLQAAGHEVVHAVASNTAIGCLPLEDGSVGGMRALLDRAFGGTAPTAIVHLRSLDGCDESDLLRSVLEGGCGSVLHLVQAISGMGWRDAPRLWLMTRGAQAVQRGTVTVRQAPLLGLGRTLALEHSELRCGRVDLDPKCPSEEVAQLVSELVGDDAEDEVAFRDGTRWVARLARLELEKSPTEQVEQQGGRSFRLEIEETGVLDRLALRAIARRPPGPGEVEIAVEAAGLNFLDILLALGAMPNDLSGHESKNLALGSECVGRIVSIGADVVELAIGDLVVALTRGAIASHVTVPEVLVVRCPEKLSSSVAAALPVATLTAWYALDKVARLQRGERVLIHAATGGVGLAAVQWAQHVGAEVFATAGTPEKRALLTNLGVRYVSDSRSSRFVSDILDWTGGEGVDVVLNSLTGELLEKSFGLLRAYGRFVEIGKRDYYSNSQLGLKPFLRNLSFSLVDLRGMTLERPELVRRLLNEMIQLWAAGSIKSPVVELFPVSRAAEAFRKMAQAQHTGKIVLMFDDPNVRVQIGAVRGSLIRADGSYLVTGGLGGLGLSVAGLLAERGAGHLLLVGRTGVATEVQRSAISALEGRGTAVTVEAVDIADRAAVARVLARISPKRPLRGVVHAAGILDDGFLLKQTPARFRAVMAPKVQGAWNLHELTQGMPLDFFVLYSSAAGLLGSPGQGNYTAANAFLDGLAHSRRAQRLPALSIDWGVFSDIGLAAAHQNRGERLLGQGLSSLTPRQGLVALERVLGEQFAQIGIVPLDARQWVEFYPAIAGSPMLSRLLAEQRILSEKQGYRVLRQRLAMAPPEEQFLIIEEFLEEQVSRVLRIGVGKLHGDTPLASLGLDSLMGLELRNRIEIGLGVRVPAPLLWTYPTIKALSRQLVPDKHSKVAEVSSVPPEALTANDPIEKDLAEMQTDELISFIDDLLEQSGQGAKQ